MISTSLPARSGPARATTTRPALARLLSGLASLRLAVVLLSLFAACLAGATLLESLHGGRAAAELVYRTWWFALLLSALAVNVVAAAVKKYPWKRHQTGFLVTHAGLLVLILGGLLTALLGVEGQMVLVDTADPALHARLGLGNQARSMYLADSHCIEVYRLTPRLLADVTGLRDFLEAVRQGDPIPDRWASQWSLTFRPGPFTWYADQHVQVRLPWWVRMLQRLAEPFPGYVLELDDGVTLSIDNFYPQAEYSPQRQEWVIPSEMPPAEQAGLQPAIRCRMSDAKRTKRFWLGLSRGASQVPLGDEVYLVQYRPARQPVHFVLTLKRAWQVKDPGTNRPAWYQSDVTVAGRDHRIVMNQPLALGPYRVYQANYRALLDPATGTPLRDGARLVSLSGLTVAHDPGMWLKYAGSLLVALGIATMFYMKAYFFKPHRSDSPL
jgi:hypothetical protein